MPSLNNMGRDGTFSSSGSWRTLFKPSITCTWTMLTEETVRVRSSLSLESSSCTSLYKSCSLTLRGSPKTMTWRGRTSQNPRVWKCWQVRCGNAPSSRGSIRCVATNLVVFFSTGTKKRSIISPISLSSLSKGKRASEDLREIVYHIVT